MKGERKLDDIITIIGEKWERMDRIWFQQHRHLIKSRHKKQTLPAGGQTSASREMQPPTGRK